MVPYNLAKTEDDLLAVSDFLIERQRHLDSDEKRAFAAGWISRTCGDLAAVKQLTPDHLALYRAACSWNEYDQRAYRLGIDAAEECLKNLRNTDEKTTKPQSRTPRAQDLFERCSDPSILALDAIDSALGVVAKATANSRLFRGAAEYFLAVKELLLEDQSKRAHTQQGLMNLKKALENVGLEVASGDELMASLLDGFDKVAADAYDAPTSDGDATAEEIRGWLESEIQNGTMSIERLSELLVSALTNQMETMELVKDKIAIATTFHTDAPTNGG